MFWTARRENICIHPCCVHMQSTDKNKKTPIRSSNKCLIGTENVLKMPALLDSAQPHETKAKNIKHP